MTPTMYPYLSYRDAAAALRFLEETFGFATSVRRDGFSSLWTSAPLRESLANPAVRVDTRAWATAMAPSTAPQARISPGQPGAYTLRHAAGRSLPGSSKRDEADGAPSNRGSG
jgi:uncharacterized glyoxalase superfamily protein PhnB